MKTLQVRDRIMEVASRLFYEQGYQLTGINQVIEEAEIARGSLYNHFTSKEELLMSYLEEVEETWFKNLDTYLSGIKDPRRKLLALFDHRIQLQQQSAFSGCRFIKISAEIDKTQHRVFSFVAAHKQKYKAIIQKLANKVAVTSPVTHAMLAESIFLFLEGASVIGAAQKDSAHFKEAKKIISKLI